MTTTDARPTAADVLAEPAGRRMDAWVSEHVMRLAPRQVRVCGGTETVAVWGAPALTDGVWFRDDLLAYGAPPRYSADIAAAWEVVEQVRRCRRMCCVTACRDGAWECMVGDTANDHRHGTAGTAPLAICRAALLAVLGDTTTGGE